MRVLALILGLILSACASDPNFQNCTPGEGAARGAGKTVAAGLSAGSAGSDPIKAAVGGLVLGVVLAPVGAIYGAVSCDKNSSPDAELRELAKQGDAEAQYELGMFYYGARPIARKWFCLAANQSHAMAQFQLGNMHRWGHEPVTLDLVQAYLWFSLAASGGSSEAGKDRAEIAKQITPAQIAEAERLVKEWKPGSCEPKSAEVAS